MIKRILGVASLLTVLGTLIVALTLTTPGRTMPPAGPAEWLNAAGPYLVVAMLGLFVGLAELSSTFPNYPLEAITSAWGLGLVGLNGGVAAATFAVSRYYAPDTDLFVLVLAVGVGFQSLIRTRFVLARQFSETGQERDLSLNVGWIYEQFQRTCKVQIDLALMRNRESAIRRLITRYPDEKTLFNLAYYTILARGTLSKEDEQARLKELTEAMSNPALPLEVVQTTMALAILEIGGQAFAEMLGRAPAGGQVAAQMASKDTLAGRLVDAYDLPDLAALAHEVAALTPAEKDKETLRRFVDGTKADTAAPEQVRRAALAHFIVDQAGIAFAAGKLALASRPGAPGE